MILGICDGHDAGAALIDGGRVVFAVSEERLSRRKRQLGWPRLAIEACRQEGPIEAVAVAERAGRLPHRALHRIYARLDPNQGATGPLARAVAEASCRLARLPFSPEPAVAARLLGRRLGRPVTLVDHHRCHAWTAASGIDAGLVITMDAFGDGLSGTVHAWDGATLRRVHRSPGPAGPALLYGQTCGLLGFGEGDEGKVTARAAHGDTAGAAIGDCLQLDGLDWSLAPLEQLRAAVTGVAPVDVAAALQARVERLVVAFVEEALRRFGGQQLGLAGGLFANVAVNRAVAAAAQAAGVQRCFVFPAMSDAGLCVGAAMELQAARWEQPRLGPDAGPGASAAAMAAALRDGPVARCAGALEFGPRALGHRSLLMAPDDAEAAVRLNARLGRDPWMPFGPVIRAEDAPELLAGWGPAVEPMTAAMTVALPATERLRRLAPAAVHVDGTARAQTLRPEGDPVLHKLLGLVPGGVLLNTSLNRHGEPIVATAAQAAAVAEAVGAWIGP